MFRIPTPSRAIALVISAAALYASSLACSSIPFLASTPTPSKTITPTVTPTPTPILANLEWPIILSEPFDDNHNSWYTGNQDSAYTEGTILISEGKYNILLTAKKPMFWWFPPSMEAVTDFFLEVDVDQSDGSTGSDYGLVFREAHEDRYYFCINPGFKNYYVALLVDGAWTKLIDWKSSNQIDPVGANHLAILAEGSHFTFYINGEEIDALEDTTLRRGRVGVGFSLYNVGDKLEIEFDNFEIRAPAD